MRINLDQLRTRNREKQFLHVCRQTRQRFVIDNTNPTKFRVISYFFQSEIEECQHRNEKRPKAQQVPSGGLQAIHVRLEIPTRDEGFDEFRYVRIGVNNRFIVRRRGGKV